MELSGETGQASTRLCCSPVINVNEEDCGAEPEHIAREGSWVSPKVLQHTKATSLIRLVSYSNKYLK
jgi:hypothetical protein